MTDQSNRWLTPPSFTRGPFTSFLCRSATRQRNKHLYTDGAGSGQRDDCQTEVHLYVPSASVSSVCGSVLELQALEFSTGWVGVFQLCVFSISFLGGGGFNAAAAAAAAAVLLSCSLKVKHGFSDSFQVFYFHELAYPPQQGRFQGHAEWSGNILNQDASVTLNNVLPTFNGTYICQVRNPPDVHGSNGEIVLRVVNKGQEKCWGNFESCAPPPFVCLLNTSAVIQLWVWTFFSSFPVTNRHLGSGSRRRLRHHVGPALYRRSSQVLQEEARGQGHRAAGPGAQVER